MYVRTYVRECTALPVHLTNVLGASVRSALWYSVTAAYRVLKNQYQCTAFYLHLRVNMYRTVEAVPHRQLVILNRFFFEEIKTVLPVWATGPWKWASAGGPH